MTMKIWKNYFLSFCNRIEKFLSNPVIVLYFCAIVVVVGSFGIWYNLFDYSKSFLSFMVDTLTISNLSVYSISILAGAMAHFMLAKKERGRGLKIFTFSIFIFGLLAAIVSLSKNGWYFGYVSLFLTYLLWVLVYVDDDVIGTNLDVNPNSPKGGDNPAGATLGGSLAGYNA